MAETAGHDVATRLFLLKRFPARGTGEAGILIGRGREVVILCIFLGCAAPPHNKIYNSQTEDYFVTKVNSYLDKSVDSLQLLTPGSKIWITNGLTADNKFIKDENKFLNDEIKSKLEAALISKGLLICGVGELFQCDYFLFWAYGVTRAEDLKNSENSSGLYEKIRPYSQETIDRCS